MTEKIFEKKKEKEKEHQDLKAVNLKYLDLWILINGPKLGGFFLQRYIIIESKANIQVRFRLFDV